MSDTLVPPPAAGPVVRPTPGAAVIASIVLVELASGVTQGFLAPLLGRLSETLGITAAQLNWLSIANLLASIAFTPVLSRMGDLYGHRRILRWNLAIVLAGSILVGLSTTFGVLLVGQVLQGAFAGFFPLLVGILRNRGTGESTRGISFMIAALVGGLGLGLVASGLVAEHVDNPTAALWVPFVAVGVAMAASWPLLPVDGPRGAGRIDWLGGVLLSVGLIAVMLALGLGGLPGWEWSSARTIATLAAGVGVIGLWVWVERRTEDPMIDVRLFASRPVAVVSLVTLTFSFCLIGMQVANPVFLGTVTETSGYGLGLSPLHIAFAMIPSMGAIAAGALIAPPVAARIGDRAILATGSMLMAAGYLGMLLMHGSLSGFLLATVVAGVGGGFQQHSTRTLAVEYVPVHQAAVGSGINELLINVGGSIGAACVLAVFAAATPPGERLPTVGAYTTSWSLAVVVSLLGAAVALLLRRRVRSAA